MDAGGLALPDDLVIISECHLLPPHALAAQIALRERELASSACDPRINREVIILRNLQDKVEKLQLALANGAFTVLGSPGIIQTCYTDRAHTSRSSTCTIAELLAFAQSIIRRFGDDETEDL